jgi:hypothetical protein
MPLCLLPIKPLSDFSYGGLKVSHKALLISYDVKSTIIIVPSHVQSRPVLFPSCEFSNASLVLTTDKATVRFCSGMKCHTNYYFLLAVKLVLFSHHINCFSECIFTNMGQLLRLLSSSYCTRAKAAMYYRYIGIFWLHESSQHHRFPEVGRPWHYWQITANAASDNQSAVNAIANIAPICRGDLTE